MSLHLKIDCGRISGGTVSGWAQDYGYTGGGDYNWGNPINITGLTDPAPSSVYETLRSATSFSYTFSGFASNGQVKIRLHLSDNQTGSSARVFDVSVNGSVPSAFNDISIAALAGNVAYKGVIVEFTGSADSSGQISLAFSNVLGFAPLVTGIELIEVPLTITTSSLPNGTVGASYSQNLTATGGTGSLSWNEPGFISGLPPGLSLSSTGLISGVPSATGIYTFSVEVIDSLGATDGQSLTITIDDPPPLPYGFTHEVIELFCEANQMSQSPGSNVASFTDKSVHARHLTATSSYPTFQTNVINGKSVIRNNGSQNPLSNTAQFNVFCGWILAKFNGTSFSGYKGLLSDLTSLAILVSNNFGVNFLDVGFGVYEYRSNDRIYPVAAAPAPMNGFKLLFFRFSAVLQVNGIQLFQDRIFTSNKWIGDVALLILSSRNYSEQEIRARSAAIAAAYGLTLADVYPYQADKSGVSETINQRVNIYDPPENGARIAEAVDNPKRILDLKFSSRRQYEIDAMKPYHAAHYPEVPCIYRNYNVSPPVDIEGYIDSPYQLEGALNNYNYSFRFKEK